MSSKSIQLHFTGESTSLDLTNKVHLEDFYDDSDSATADRLENLTLSISFDNGTPAEIEALYMSAIQNLKKVAPNLKSVKFVGGYFYTPVDDNADTFRRELADLRGHLDSLSKLFVSQELPVTSVHFNGIQVFEKCSINEAFYFDLINELFDHRMSEEEVQAYTAEFTYTPDGIPFEIKLLFNVQPSPNEPKNRRRCFLDEANRCRSDVESC